MTWQIWHIRILKKSLFPDDFLIVEPVDRGAAYLVFDELRVETFRGKRRAASASFTHLEYDCQARETPCTVVAQFQFQNVLQAKWAYAYIPAVVAAALVALVLFNLLVRRPFFG